MRAAYALVIAVWLTSLLSQPALAEKRVALVIGNGAYQNAPTLKNSRRDADDIASALQRLGFAVTRLADGNLAETRRAVSEFDATASVSEMAVVFYAGHGIEAAGDNWLIPIDAELRTEIDTEQQAINLRLVMKAAGKAQGLGLVILDACRDNPFSIPVASASSLQTESGKQRSGTRSVGKGLAPANPSGNVLVAFAARDGTVASDGSGENSPFTSALLKHMETPGLEVTFLFRRVRDEVMAATKAEQQPFVYGSLSTDSIYLKPPTQDQILGAMPISALPRQPNSMFVEEIRKRVASVAEKKQLKIPDFQIDAMEEDLPENLKKFVGVWVSKVGAGGGTGRQSMAIIKHVDKDGIATGYYAWGPPNKNTWDPNSPAGFAAFKGKIVADYLRFGMLEANPIRVSLNLLKDYRISAQLTRKEKDYSFNTLYPVWNMVLSARTPDAAGSASSSALCETGFRADGDRCVKITCGTGYRINEDGECEKKPSATRDEQEPRQQPRSVKQERAPSRPQASAPGQIVCIRGECRPVRPGCRPAGVDREVCN